MGDSLGAKGRPRASVSGSDDEKVGTVEGLGIRRGELTVPNIEPFHFFIIVCGLRTFDPDFGRPTGNVAILCIGHFGSSPRRGIYPTFPIHSAMRIRETTSEQNSKWT